MSRDSIHTFTKLVDEPFFLECGKLLTHRGVQVATILTVDRVRIERMTRSKPERWEIAFDSDPDEGQPTITDVQVLDDGAMVAGILEADPDDSPPPGKDYMILAECTIQMTQEYGGATVGRVFRRRAQIPASALTTQPSA